MCVCALRKCVYLSEGVGGEVTSGRAAARLFRASESVALNACVHGCVRVWVYAHVRV